MKSIGDGVIVKEEKWGARLVCSNCNPIICTRVDLKDNSDCNSPSGMKPTWVIATKEELDELYNLMRL